MLLLQTTCCVDMHLHVTYFSLTGSSTMKLTQRIPLIDAYFVGTGDLFAALLLARLDELDLQVI